ncbi:MAG: VIT1/CCC1 family protein [Verrucomicrobiae bacterium]|nr:VIT1/CCC1 family protein [Verrucomicrobiae bacterium]
MSETVTNRPALEPSVVNTLVAYQTIEITEYHLYQRLAGCAKNPKNRETLLTIAREELRHYNQLRELTGRDVQPMKVRLMLFYWLARIFGLTFGLKLMEKGEERAQANYKAHLVQVPILEHIFRDEAEHEDKLIAMIEEEYLNYVGSVVLGLNDALVELTGALAGLTLAFQNGRLIAVTGVIVGVAAALSMAASEYLSTKAEATDKRPVKSAAYTGLAYIVTVLLLVLPYLVLSPPLLSLVVMLGLSVGIIAAFNFYVAVALDRPFWQQFGEMALISFGVAAVSFGLGYIVRIAFGIEV